MPPRVQIAFQGGGARFVEMLPIAHALADAHNKGHIQITRVAGSSAGAICAALLACNVDFVKARRFIAEEGSRQLPMFQRWSSKLPSRALRIVLALNQARKSVTLLRTEILIGFLSKLLKASGSTHTLLEHVNNAPDSIKLAITGSDLSLSKGKVFEHGNLLEAIVHSCAIPFALRGWKEVKTSPYVDGGVCENLPVEHLLKFEDEDGPVFAVSLIEEETGTPIPDNAIDYCLQLISASMNHNVARAKELIGQPQILEAKTKLTTFDFKGAIAKLTDDSFYTSAYDNTWSLMLRHSQLHKTARGVSPFYLSGRVSAPKIMRSLFRVFESSLRTTEWSYKKAAFLVRADCLRPPLNERVRLPDQIVRFAKIQAKEGGLVCFNSSVAMTAEGSIMPTAWNCFNEIKQKELMIQAVPADNVAAKTRGMRDVLLFFENPKLAISANDEITVSAYYPVGPNMLGLETKGSDYIGLVNPHPVPVEVADVVLAYPVDVGELAAAVDTSVGIRDAVRIQDKDLKAEYGGKFSSDYRFLGLRTTNLGPGEKFRVIFTKVPQG